MRFKNRLFAVFLMVVFLLSQLPVYAWAGDNWENPQKHEAPQEYKDKGKSLYTREHWTKFYINYNGYDLGESGAKYVGALYAEVFDTPNDITQGFTGVHPNRNLWQPGNQNDADIESFLKGFQVPRGSTGHWLVSPSYLSTQNETVLVTSPSGEKFFVETSARYVLSNQSGMKRDVPVQKVSGSWNVPPGTTVREPVKVSNSPVDTAGGRLNNGSGRAVYWRAWNGSYGARALTQHAAAALYNYPNTSSAVVIASFPYNVYVPYVKKVYDNGNTASYDWAVVNQTPLHLWNITVRVYTKGKKTGKWNLVQIYNNIDIPPAKRDGSGLTREPSSKDIMAQAAGRYSVAYPLRYTEVPKPSEDYDVIVTANVNLNIQSGQASFPSASIDSGMRGAYDAGGVSGAAPPGLPPAETVEQWNKASSILGVSLPRGYNDNVASASDTGAALPPPPGSGDTAGPNDLAVTSIEVLDAATGQPVSSPQENQNLKVKATFKSSFNVGGWARLRLYKYQVEYKRLDQVGDSVNMYFEPNATKTYEWSPGNIGTGQYKFIVSIDYYNNGNDPSSGWRAEKFDGKYDEKTYDNNKMEKDLTGTEAPPWEPHPVQWSQPVWYPPLVWKEVPVYETITEPIYGWKKVTFRKEEPTDVKKRVRLTE
ncbi:hypothetical protein [Desulfofundulus thermosubterraneus]|uniref:Uncharacterized protein n=1 Tax=Desulfofundulus thermosubterraneus DSM 16057 TaxID=1121432 RepID=A0A1M6H029_9FIRM|nr:hypothetical protein [Desulfofundulus thermosubterraneus]SHJ15548.1 hypothetical protein SAMN02745219_01871 [Desulfofundulus thermosubterraneus DSM 16057]